MPTQFKILGMFVLSTLRQLQAGAGTIITGILDITDEVMEISEQRNGQGHTAGEGGQARPVAVWGALHPGPHHRRAFAHQGQSPFLGSTPSHQLQVTTPAQASAPSVRPSVCAFFQTSTAPGCACPGWCWLKEPTPACSTGPSAQRQSQRR